MNNTPPEYIQKILTLYPELLIIWVRISGFPALLYRTEALRMIAVHKGYPVKSPRGN